MQCSLVKLGMTLMVCQQLASACRSGSDSVGESPASTAEFSGNRVDITSSITSQTGSQSQMQGWVVALIERDSATGRVSEADANGNLKFEKASLSAAHTVALFSPDFLLQGVLGLPTNKSKTVRQYFSASRALLPRLVQRGTAVSFQTNENLTILDYYATDDNEDGVPDGVASFGLADMGGRSLTLADTDKDGLENLLDIDIDGDGIINGLDSDDDGDGILDIVDSDANGDGIGDNLQQSSDQHFAVGLNYLTADVITNGDGQSVRFVAKVRDGVKVSSVAMRGATSLFAGATITAADGSSVAWDLTLADDGLSDDGAAGDLMFARTVVLASGVTPRTNQAVFFKVTVVQGVDTFVVEYPYLFPNVTPEVPTTSYDSATRIVTLAGDPFGASIQNFLWTVTVKNSEGLRIYEGTPVVGSTRTIALPANILVAGQAYTYTATAQLLEKVPGYPSMTVQSIEGAIQN